MIGAGVATVAGIVAGAVLGGVVRGVVEVVVVVALVEPDCPFELDPSAAVVRTESVGEPPINGKARQPSVTRAARQNEGTRAELRPLAQSQIATGRANTHNQTVAQATDNVTNKHSQMQSNTKHFDVGTLLRRRSLTWG